MAILHDSLPFKVWMDPRLTRLPGILPMDPEDWLRVDEAYAGQMAERARLIAGEPGAVTGALPGSEPAVAELAEAVEARLPGLGFAREGAAWRCPDGRLVADGGPVLARLGQLVQEDLCVMEAGPEGHHVLTAAVLCFPASWTLVEKLGRGLPGIHRPVSVYDEGLAARVQRLFDAVRVGQPLWRANVLDYVDPSLYQPRSEANRREKPEGPRGFIRSERQGLMRLPRTQAVIFSIHTYVVAREMLTAEEEAAFSARPR
ncbi:heme-dependent oxidative N-demethylase family protein [Pararhodobacter aggregans]|uniref:DUF3445 domain-containing protein n=1 Tax=Pararhodobacter aggregans TaxID=404875 RepID=A0A2T7UYC5_9RHOB|nr:DUF3445 domain-containing protein [Pararhodobacter aggregans]PTX05199.1 uncharacterized protein DUF3445 [Pararhodobacter aggregans]PVE49498.1 DUF3445 domain-containing protein [Pararhodobacter aggregans]